MCCVRVSMVKYINNLLCLFLGHQSLIFYKDRYLPKVAIFISKPLGNEKFMSGYICLRCHKEVDSKIIDLKAICND